MPTNVPPILWLVVICCYIGFGYVNMKLSPGGSVLYRLSLRSAFVVSAIALVATAYVAIQ